METSVSVVLSPFSQRKKCMCFLQVRTDFSFLCVKIELGVSCEQSWVPLWSFIPTPYYGLLTLFEEQ